MNDWDQNSYDIIASILDNILSNVDTSLLGLIGCLPPERVWFSEDLSLKQDIKVYF